ncbi:MAG: hypothetical protein EZS28_021120, partial [Streblomastix strix]
AMGFRNIISSEMERRNRRKLELEEEIVDRSTELQRLKAELDSLVQTETQQQQMIQSLLTMEPAPQ